MIGSFGAELAAIIHGMCSEVQSLPKQTSAPTESAIPTPSTFTSIISAIFNRWAIFQ
jgi:hypothetical protein